MRVKEMRAATSDDAMERNREQRKGGSRLFIGLHFQRTGDVSNRDAFAQATCQTGHTGLCAFAGDLHPPKLGSCGP